MSHFGGTFCRLLFGWFRLAAAYCHYLRFDHPARTALLSQVVAALFAASAAILLDNCLR